MNHCWSSSLADECTVEQVHAAWCSMLTSHRNRSDDTKQQDNTWVADGGQLATEGNDWMEEWVAAAAAAKDDDAYVFERSSLMMRTRTKMSQLDERSAFPYWQWTRHHRMLHSRRCFHSNDDCDGNEEIESTCYRINRDYDDDSHSFDCWSSSPADHNWHWLKSIEVWRQTTFDWSRRDASINEQPIEYVISASIYLAFQWLSGCKNRLWLFDNGVTVLIDRIRRSGKEKHVNGVYLIEWGILLLT